MEKLAVLLRVSSLPQERDGGGLELQRKMGKKMGEMLGLDVVEFNEGSQSSFNVDITGRPVLIELLNDIQKKDGIRKVWVFNTDRLGRQQSSTLPIVKVFIDNGVELYVGESPKPYDFSNIVDKLHLNILSAISQYDNELRRLRSVFGKRNSLKNKNTYVGGTPPFGYFPKNKHLYVSDKESKYVKKMFEMYKDGKSPMEIKFYLDKQNEIEPRRRGKGWNIGTVLTMLKNPLYKGVQTWNWKEKLPNGEHKIIETIELNVPRIVSDELWNKVQERIRDNYHLKLDGSPNKSLLKGLLICPKCKLKLGHRFKKNNHYYGKCSEVNWRRTDNKLDTKNCVLKKSVLMEHLDEKVVKEVSNVFANSLTILDTYKQSLSTQLLEDEERIKKEVDGLKRKIRVKQRELKQVEQEEVMVEFDVRLKKIPKTKGKQLLKRFGNYRIELNDEIEKLINTLHSYDTTKGWVNYVSKVNEEIEQFRKYGLKQKRDFLKKLINRIFVEYVPQNKSHKITIEFNSPIVGDELMVTGIKNVGTKTNENYQFSYKIVGGTNILETEMKYVSPHTKKKQQYRDKVMIRVGELKKEGLSLPQISDKLNEERIYSPTGSKWYKSSLSSFYSYHSQKSIESG
jgi:site-specific DNA recombinase